MKIVTLASGYIALVDDDDFEWINKKKWRVKKPQDNRTVYSMASIYIGDSRCKSVYMHREIMAKHFGAKSLDGMTIDHIDGNGLNNQKTNLRICTQSDNNKNSKARSHCVSGFKGVTLLKGKQKYIARIRVDGKDKFIGSYKDPVDAAIAYDRACKKLRGEFAVLNFPEST